MESNINKSKDLINIKSTIIVFVSVTIGLIGFLESSISFFGDSNVFFKSLSGLSPFYKLLIVLLLSTSITSIKVIIALYNEANKIKQENSVLLLKCEEFERAIDEKDGFVNSHSDSICFLLEEATNRKRYQEVISIGSHISLPLWYTGKYALRIKIGHMVEFAAAQVDDKKMQALVLIEDIGWTNIRIKEYSKGIDNIKRGLDIATSIGDYYLIAQAKRNLADIHLIKMKNSSMLSEKNNEATSCKACLDEAVEYANKLDEIRDKNELIGNIHYTYCKYYFELGEYNSALESLDTSMEVYSDNGFTEKRIKLYVLKGKILLEQDKENISRALNVFQEGLRMAQAYNVNVHIVTNAIELCKIYISYDNTQLAKQMLSIAKEVIDAISDPVIVEEYNNCNNLLNGDE